MFKKVFLFILAACFLTTAAMAAEKKPAPKNPESTTAATTATKPAETAPVADASKPMEFDLTLGDPEDSEMGVLAIAFKNYVAQASNGRMKIDLAYSGGLDADETYQFHRVQTGKLAMAIGGIGNLAPMVRNLGVVTLPYIFPNVEAVVAGTTGKAAELLNSYAEKAGLRILAWTYYGYRYISNSKRPIQKIEDMKRLRMRVPQSLAMIKTYRAFGAIPMPLAWPMTRSALKNGLVDGQCYDLAGFRVMKFQDVGQKYITEIHYLYNLQPLVINEKLFNSLPKEDQKILVDAGKQIQDLSLQYQKEMNAMARRMLISEGVHITTIEDEAPWREVAISKVWPDAADNIGGKDAINAYLKACGMPEWDVAKEESAK